MTTPEEPSSGYWQEPEFSQEDKEMIASLPVEKGWSTAKIHQYHGFWLPPRPLQGALAFQKHFQAQETDIFIVTFPKSGTTWLKAIVFALMNRARYPDLEQHPLLTDNPHALVPFVDLEYGDKLPDFSNLNTPRLLQTHLPYVLLPKSMEESGCKIVYLCRNAKDNFVSLWHFANKVNLENMRGTSLEEALDKFCRGESAYGPFWDHALSYWRKKQEAPQRVLFLQYEDLKKEPVTQLRILSEFLGCPFSREEEIGGMLEDIVKLCSFDNLSKLEVNKNGKWQSAAMMHEAFFRRGQIGDAMNFLTKEMLEQIDRVTLEKFQDSGLELNNF